jgi:GTP-binding protein Era
VAILGRPNAGKSTLLNALLGTKLAIVAAKPQTTRTSIQGVLTLPGAQMVFLDTPGIHKSDTPLNRRMMDAVRAAAEAPDVILFVIDVLATPTHEDTRALDLAKKAGAPVIAVLNKIDWLKEKPEILKRIEQYRAWHDFAAFVPISARRGTGIDELRDEIVKHLPAGPALFPEDYLTDQPERFFAAEVIREKVLHHTEQEVPHAVAVGIDTWEETPKLIRIAATIYVEKPGQKAILIGSGGAMLKKIGTQARQDLERAFERKVFLETFVKVRSRWREEAAFLPITDWRL